MPTMLVALFAAGLLLVMALIYVGRNADLNASNKKVASLKQEYEQLQTDNDNREALLNASVDVRRFTGRRPSGLA